MSRPANREWRRRATRRRPSVAELQMQMLARKPLTLPQGADRELAALFGEEVDE